MTLTESKISGKELGYQGSAGKRLGHCWYLVFKPVKRDLSNLAEEGIGVNGTVESETMSQGLSI